MAMIDDLREMKRTRESHWRRYPQTSPTKLHWRAITVRIGMQRFGLMQGAVVRPSPGATSR
jgi:hypothetical protein